MFYATSMAGVNRHSLFTPLISAMAAILMIVPFSFLPNVVYRVRQIADINQIQQQETETAGSYPSHPIELGGKLFFTANDGIHGVELWSSTGRADGTAMLLDIVPGAAGSYPDHLTVVAQTLFFTARDPDQGTTNLWRSDGTPAGTAVAIQMGTITSLTAIGGKLYLFDSAGMWVSDGTAEGTILLRQMPPPAFPLMEVNGTAYFLIWTTMSYVLFTSDGTPAGTHVVSIITVGSKSAVTQQLVVNNRMFFVTGLRSPFPFLHFTYTHLIASDGTSVGTVLVKTFVPADDTHRQPLIGPITAIDTTLYFAAEDSEHGSELWKSDGTAEGTTLVADIVPGANGSGIQQLASAGDTLYFAANDGVHGSELWKSDGTAEGTVLVADIAPGAADSSLEQMTPAPIAGWIVFSASDGSTSKQLWMSDGTAAGTTRVGTLTPDATALLPSWIGHGLGRILLIADDGHTGLELWSLTAWRLVEW